MLPQNNNHGTKTHPPPFELSGCGEVAGRGEWFDPEPSLRGTDVVPPWQCLASCGTPQLAQLVRQ